MPVKKSRKSYQNKRTRKSKKRVTRKIYKKHSMRGGNFGGNCPDPNFSIYNTNLLKLFPYHF